MFADHDRTIYEDWFNRGKEDAWLQKPKHPPEQDPEAASLYDLGYSEGEIQRPAIETQSAVRDKEQ